MSNLIRGVMALRSVVIETGNGELLSLGLLSGLCNDRNGPEPNQRCLARSRFQHSTNIMNTPESESTPTQTLYEIVDESFAGQGPFTGEEIDAMVKAGDLGKTQKVRKVHSGKEIAAHFALLSAKANDRAPSPPTKGKFFAGILMLLIGLGGVAFLLFARDEGEHVRAKLFIIPGLLIAGGFRMVVGNSQVLKANG